MPTDHSVTKALERLGAHFSSDPELDKPHPLQTYATIGLLDRIDRQLMSESLYDSSIPWTEAEDELARKIGLYAMAFLIVFGLWLGVEANSRAVKPTEPFSTSPPTFISPSEDSPANDDRD